MLDWQVGTMNKQKYSVIFSIIFIISLFLMPHFSLSEMKVQPIEIRPGIKSCNSYLIILVPGISGEASSMDAVKNSLLNEFCVPPAQIKVLDFQPRISLREKSNYIRLAMQELETNNPSFSEQYLIIAHSLGGIVTEDFLISATNEELKKIKGVTFIDATTGSSDLIYYAIYSAWLSWASYYFVPSMTLSMIKETLNDKPSEPISHFTTIAIAAMSYMYQYTGASGFVYNFCKGTRGLGLPGYVLCALPTSFVDVYDLVSVKGTGSFI